MKNSHGSQSYRSLIIACVALVTFASLAWNSSARSTSTSTSVNVVNNSNRSIRNVYISHVDQDDWSDNQLGGATISAGQSYNLSISACDQSQVKVIGEDDEGCFVSTVVSCGASSTWTITAETARDCGQY